MSQKTTSRKPANFLATILILQYTLFAAINFNIPTAIQIIGILYLTLIPGLVLTKLLKMNELDTAEIILFSAGLSIAFSMIIGLLINELGPLFGMTKPLSLMPILITQSTITLIGALIAYLKNGETQKLRFGKEVIPTLAASLTLIILGIISTLAINTT
ncbi:MAG: hypothetical protein QXF61_09970, partial [Nitrososphaeria archaeon]